MPFRSYIHVERIERLPGFLEGLLTVTPKVDSTNAVVWFDDKVKCGSRTRELTATEDNAGFYEWIHSDAEEAVALRDFVTEFPHLIVYGEWIPTTKFIGAIKTYNSDALGSMRIFDIYDTKNEHYLVDQEWRNLIKRTPLKDYAVPILAVLENPTYEELLEIAKSNKYLLDNAENAGEGIVCRNPGYRDEYGHYQIGKLVLDEYRQNKSESKKKGPIENCESNIVEKYLTDAELVKAREKVCVLLELDEFDKTNGKCIGMYLNLVWKDFIEENIMDILKKYKNPIIDFATMNFLVKDKARKYIGLV